MPFLPPNQQRQRTDGTDDIVNGNVFKDGKPGCISLSTDKLEQSFLQAGCPSCHPTDSVKALKA